MAAPGQGTALGGWFDRLAGEWHLEREASDGSRFVGKAVFSRVGPESLLLEETGELTLPDGSVLQARRAWIWRLTGDGELAIDYPPEAGGGAYHRFRPLWQNAVRQNDPGQDDCWIGEAEHLCGADRYRARYRLAGDRIGIDHHVTGPAKDYRLFGRLTRAPARPI